VFAALVFISVGAAVVVTRGKLPADFPAFDEPKDAGPSLLSLTPPPPAEPLALADAGTHADAGSLAVDAGTQDGGMDGGADAGTEPMLELVVDPRVEALLSDGGTLGRTPLTVPLPAGRYVLSLSNPSLGINTARVVNVAPAGHTVARFYLNKGYVNVRAPQGATVQVDGHNVGTAPVDELDLYEGQHRLVVTVEGSRWQRAFTLDAAQRVTFTVDFENEDE
jgi:serine/threonine-protein kinase